METLVSHMRLYRMRKSHQTIGSPGTDKEIGRPFMTKHTRLLFGFRVATEIVRQQVSMRHLRLTREMILILSAADI